MDAPQQTSALLGCSFCLPVPLDRTTQPHLGTHEAQHPEDSGLTQAPGPTSRPLFSHVSQGPSGPAWEPLTVALAAAA